MNDDAPATAQDRVNRTVWMELGQVARFASAAGWIDRSERVLVERVMGGRTDLEVLDIGVGGGRTVPLLSTSAARYVGIDFLEELVAAARRRFPDADLRVGDARALDFPDASFDVVMFSSNGLDAISHADRETALHEIRRVLRSDGVFLFSTHNSDGPGPRERPWGVPPVTLKQPRSSARTVARRVMHLPIAVKNFRRLRPLGSSGNDWRVTVSGAHDFGLLVHYTTAAGLLTALRDAGFLGEVELWDDRAGLPAATARPQNRWWYFNVLARCSPAALV
ncbi:MAG TPA: class I SAM-dependent methyltransferase [Ilumatobacteraceae bacterium]|jgi:ubiquinone/menaquinone biosynthesis C-methylase UbiE